MRERTPESRVVALRANVKDVAFGLIPQWGEQVVTGIIIVTAVAIVGLIAVLVGMT